MSETPLPDLPDFCWPVDTTCIPNWDAWEVEPDPEADPPVVGVPYYSDEDKARAISLAGQTMRLLTGFRIGGCPITVRPCKAGCSDPTWRTYPPGGGGVWQPVNMGGSWLNIACGCGSGGCACTTVQEVRLYGPASGIELVKIDGATLDPSAYRLDPGGRLVRTDGDVWPACQNMNEADTEAGTFSVTYSPGAAVDGLGAWAAGLLAAEYVEVCSTGKCKLPASVSQIVRNGVTMTLTPGAFPGGKTGLRAVDSYLESVNPNGLKAAPMAWSPDIARPRTIGG